MGNSHVYLNGCQQEENMAPDIICYLLQSFSWTEVLSMLYTGTGELALSKVFLDFAYYLLSNFLIFPVGAGSSKNHANGLSVKLCWPSQLQIFS